MRRGSAAREEELFSAAHDEELAEDAGKLARMADGERRGRFEADIDVGKAGDLEGGFVEKGKAGMDDLEIEIGKIDRGVVDVAVLEGVHGDGAERHRLVHGDHPDAVLPAALEDGIKKIAIVEALHPHGAVDHVDGI